MSSFEGFIVVPRRILLDPEHPFYRLTAIQQAIALKLIGKARFQDGAWHDQINNVEVLLERGEVVVSRKGISNWFRGRQVTEQNVRTALDKMETIGLITRKTTNHYTIVKVNNYDVFQPIGQKTNQQNNQQDANKLPPRRQEEATNNNGKNESNVEEGNITSEFEKFRLETDRIQIPEDWWPNQADMDWWNDRKSKKLNFERITTSFVRKNREDKNTFPKKAISFAWRRWVESLAEAVE